MNVDLEACVIGWRIVRNFIGAGGGTGSCMLKACHLYPSYAIANLLYQTYQEFLFLSFLFAIFVSIIPALFIGLHEEEACAD
jgi:hypothetical protein